MSLHHQLHAIADSTGTDFFGVADLTPAHEAILEQGGPEIATYPRAVSVGLAIPHAIVDQLPQRADRMVTLNYRHHCYDVINQRLDLITSQISGTLQRAGHRAWPVPASQTVDEKRLCGLFSHKLAAHLAGLGWIGRSCLLITPQAGPRVRWATVLTDAPIPATGKPMEVRCGTCRQCVETCPAQAFTGEPFREAEPREARYDTRKCEQYLVRMRETNAKFGVCGMCLYVGPHGKRQASGERLQAAGTYDGGVAAQ